MSRANLYVRFPDGTVRYSIYHGTSDIAGGSFFDTPEEAWRESGGPHDHSDADEAVEVELATDYGGGWSWHGTATREHLIDGADPWDGRTRVDGVPEWAVKS